MAAYTTEVRTICEEITGVSCSYVDSDEVINRAAPMIFAHYPIFDENHRTELNAKILRHYFFREICMETVGAWKLMLNARMREIMPYYNKLYESESLKFNPLWDIDRYTDIEGASSGSSSRNTQRNTLKTASAHDTGSEGTAESDNRTTQRAESSGLNENSANNMAASGTAQEQTASSTGAQNISSAAQNTQVREATSGAETGNTKGAESSSSRSAQSNTNTGNSKEEYGSDTKSATSSNGETDETGKDKESQWTLFSDTPQGSLGGALGALTSDVDGGTASDTNTYLTNATHIYDARSAEKKSGNAGANATAENVSTNRLNNEEESSSNATAALSSSETSGSEGRENSFATAKSESGESSNKTNTDSSSANMRKSSDSRAESSTAARNTEASNAAQSAEQGSSARQRETDNAKSEAEAQLNRDTDDVAHSDANAEKQHVYGKSGGRTYARMIAELRDSYLNIDMMIIDKLKDLFMWVY